MKILTAVSGLFCLYVIALNMGNGEYLAALFFFGLFLVICFLYEEID